MSAILRAFAATILIFFNVSRAEEPATLPQSAPLTWQEADLSERLMNSAHGFVERKIADAKAKRAMHWLGDNAAETESRTVEGDHRRGR